MSVLLHVVKLLHATGGHGTQLSQVSIIHVEHDAGLAQAHYHFDARKRWELEQAELRALELHHKHVSVQAFTYQIHVP